MIISLAGYMGCGKSRIAKTLSTMVGYKLLDLDREIEKQNQLSTPEIFSTKGEIYFRREENRILGEILNEGGNAVLSLGGGTPAYYQNMELINDKSTSIYLRASIATLAKRLMRQKVRRPLIAKIADEDLPEFIAKHLFERNIFYNKCRFIIDTDEKLPIQICEEIIQNLPFQP